jgi:hypothetical protein
MSQNMCIIEHTFSRHCNINASNFGMRVGFIAHFILLYTLLRLSSFSSSPMLFLSSFLIVHLSFINHLSSMFLVFFFCICRSIFLFPTHTSVELSPLVSTPSTQSLDHHPTPTNPHVSCQLLCSSPFQPFVQPLCSAAH